MTREEALKVLRCRSGWNLSIRDANALDMAIRALEQQSCEDAISRVDALKALDYDIKSFEFKSGVGKHMNEIANLLNTIYEIQSDNIKALLPVQSKQIKCEDAISRKDILNCQYTINENETLGIPTKNVVNVDDILNAKPVTPQPKIGHWIYEKRKRLINETDEGAEYATDYWCKCSKCGGDFGYRKMKDAFCKYCGAKMVEPQESEE